MYEDLAHTQDAPFEHFVMTSVIPSLLITSFLHADVAWKVRPRPESVLPTEYVLVCNLGPMVPPLEEFVVPWPEHTGVGVAEVMAVQTEAKGARFWQYGRWPPLDALHRGVLTYPERLRPAAIEGRVVLEAVIDTLGHVEPGSVVVVESAHPAFVAPAQRALVASLFRPARVAGRAVRVRVRLAFDFVLRDGRL